MTALPPHAPKASVTPAGAWRALSDAMAALVPPIAGRGDLAVACAPGAGYGHPACFLPGEKLIEVDGRLLGVDPATADPARPSDRDRYPVLWGATVHECGHAAHSKWAAPPATTAAWAEAARMLEESRIEHAQVTRRPGDRRWLRATATRLILDDFTAAGAAPATAREAGSAAALVLARASAGILDPGETARVAATVAGLIGADRLKRLEDTWRAAHTVADTDARAMVRLGRRWCRILGINPDTPPERTPGVASSSPVAGAVREAAAAIAAAVADDFAPPSAVPPGRAAERAAENAARASADRAAATVFDRDTARKPAAITGARRPGEAEKTAARRLARALRAASAGERAPVTIASATPPGRLRMRQALAADAQRAAGALPTAAPFTRTMRRRVPAPPLRVGIACDISGSMRAFAGPVASAAWILARATAAIPAATTATVIYGEHVHPVTWPGHAPAQVTQFIAADGTEKFCRAVDALDGALSLSRPGAARLLVIVSDGDYLAGERDGGQRKITRLAASGCGILWLAPKVPWAKPMTGPQILTLADPAAAVDTIARAATRALTT